MLFCFLVTEIVLHIMLELLWQLSNSTTATNRIVLKKKQLLNAVPAGFSSSIYSDSISQKKYGQMIQKVSWNIERWKCLQSSDFHENILEVR